MRTIRQISGVAVLAAAALWASACAPVRVNASLERGMDFTRYASFTWANEEEFNTGDPRLDNNEFFEKRLRAGEEQALTAHGFEQTTAATADLVVHYHASTTQKIDVNELDYRYGYCEECHSSIYDAGTITIDLVDAKTRKLVWRGWSDGSLDGIDSQTTIEARVDEAVAKIMKQLPPRI
jgi:hypothetical protein